MRRKEFDADNAGEKDCEESQGNSTEEKNDKER